MKTEITNKNFMKKNNFKFFFLIAILFVANPGLIFAEELVPIEPEIVTTEEIVPIEEIITTNENSPTSTEEFASSTTDVPVVSTTTEEISESFLLTNFSSEDSNDATNTITVNLNVRYQDSLVFSGPVILINGATTTVIDSKNNNIEVVKNTVFGALNQADQTDADFNLSDFTYYDSMKAIFINCLEIATTTDSSLENACGYWQYVVNGKYSYLSTDQYNLSDGDNIYFYFGTPLSVELATSTIEAGHSFVATAKSYDYQNNIYVPAPNYTIGVIEPNSWPTKVFFSTTSDSLGQGIFTIDQVGNYGIGIADDYYPYQSFSVIDSSSNASTTSATTTDSTSNNDSTKKEKIDDIKAIAFLHDNQNSNGSFGDDLYTDWAAIGLAATGNSSDKALIKNYLISHNFSADSLTDYERHTMALMSLGINPYTGTNKNYISKILEEFDAEQFGEKGLINDDIFALLPLLNAGYGSSDVEISKAVAYLISKQNSNGSFESVDLTAAAIQALSLVTDLPKVSSSLAKAETYLKNSKQSDGSYGNIFATLWVMQALGDSSSEKYLASKQNQDGGLEFDSSSDNRVWATAYLIPAYYGKSWDELMTNFKKLKIETSNKSNSDVDEEGLLDSVSAEEVILENIDEVEINNEILTIEPESQTLKDAQTKTEQIFDEKAYPRDENNLQANALDGVEESGLLEIMSSFVDTTLAGLSTMLGFIVSLFNF